MALSFAQKPINSADKLPVITNWNPVISYMLYQNSSIASFYYYKLVLEVYSGQATTATNLVAKIKQRRNGYSADLAGNYARAFFDLRDIINSLLVDTIYDQNVTSNKTIHFVGSNDTDKIYSENGDKTQVYGDGTTTKTQILGCRVRGYQNYSSGTGTSPVDVETGAITDDLFYMAASLPLQTPRDSDTQYIQSSTAFDKYKMNGSTDLFLSDAKYDDGTGVIEQKVQDNDYHTIAFLNDRSNFQSELDTLRIIYYNSSDSAITTTDIANSTANGGQTPTAASSDSERIIYFGCGPGNLESYDNGGTNNQRPSNNSGWAYYKITGFQTTPSSQIVSKTYKFVKQDASCKGYKTRRLAWRNSLGCYDYFNFNMKSTQTVKVERNTFSTLLGEFNNSVYTYTNSDRGKNTRQTTAKIEETLNTDWLNEDDTILIENLIKSINVTMLENSDTEFTQPVMVTDSNFIRKTVANDGVKIQYTIKIEYANPLNTNS